MKKKTAKQTEVKEYQVIFRINVDGKNPVDAAVKAKNILMDSGAQNAAYEVLYGNDVTTVDFESDTKGEVKETVSYGAFMTRINEQTRG